MKQLMPFDFLIKASVVHEIFHIYVFNMLKRCYHRMADKFALCGDIHSHTTHYQISSTVSSASLPQQFLAQVHFLSTDQQSGIHCLIICAFHLFTPNNLGGI